MPFETERSKIAHLLRRAGFGASKEELDYYTDLGFDAAVDELVNYDRVPNDQLELDEAALEIDRTKLDGIKYLWLYRMVYTRRPLQEKMVLFWHNHFATANRKVGRPLLMWRQNELFRQHALDDFRTIVRKVSRDPAMLVWLDNRVNHKRAPNENYARELMELFTTGIGHYTESDVKEAARAFTGWTLDRSFEFVFVSNQHDYGQKTFMGRTGNFDGDDIIEVLVGHPATAQRIGRKLFAYFAYPDPEPEVVERLASIYLGTGFSIKAVVEHILRSPEFLSERAFHSRIKEPVELMVGAIKALGVKSIGPDLHQYARRMGQELFNPPDVSGWKGGTAWIGASTLLERFNFANRLASSRLAERPYYWEPDRLLESAAFGSVEELVDLLGERLLDGDLTPEARQALVDYVASGSALDLYRRAGDKASGEQRLVLDPELLDRKVRGLVHLVMSTPGYQMA